MTFKLEIQPKKDYLHIKVTGENCFETVSAYLDKILEECQARNCNKVLVEEHLDGPRLVFSEIYEVASESSLKAFGKIHAMAIVDLNAEDDSMLFGELIARNRAFPVRVLKTVREAEVWLEEQSSKESVH
jgi:hypothetical protein